MARRARRLNPDAPIHVAPVLDWIVSDVYTAPSGRILRPGTEVSIRGERGRFRFLRHVARPNGAEWIDVIGGPSKCASWRSFRPARISKVHRLVRLRENAA